MDSKTNFVVPGTRTSDSSSSSSSTTAISSSSSSSRDGGRTKRPGKLGKEELAGRSRDGGRTKRPGKLGKEELAGRKSSRRRGSTTSVALNTGRFAITSSSSKSTSTGSRTYSSSSVGRGGSSPSRVSPSSVAGVRLNSSSSRGSSVGGVSPIGRKTPPRGRSGRYYPSRPHGARPSAGSRRRKPPLPGSVTSTYPTSRGRGSVVAGARKTTAPPPQRRGRPKTPLRISPKYTDKFKKWKGLVQGCNCDPRGSLGSTCDIVTGLCRCRNNVVGRTCSRCKDGYWGHSSASGCLPCECDVIGSVTKQCDDVTGQCQCRPGVGGPRCDQCLPGYFGFSPRGCRACDVCESPGHMCDPDTGRCVCPHSTQGDRCDRCAPGSWGYDITRGCKPCNCSGPGSLSQQCDLRTGQCSCRTGFQGRRCDSCAFSHYGYPTCAECRCDAAGTQPELCDATTGRCQCDETGQCPCKANAEGRACGKCKFGTFGLAPDNRDGCTLCFCFRRSETCTQAQLTWTQLRLPLKRVLNIDYSGNASSASPSAPASPSTTYYTSSSSFSSSSSSSSSSSPTITSSGVYFRPWHTNEICFINLALPGNRELSLSETETRLNVTNQLHVIPGSFGDVSIGTSLLFDTPLYWQLPQEFMRDKVLSYNGYLRFTVESKGGTRKFPDQILQTYPLVSLQGNYKLVLEHFAPKIAPDGRYEVRLHEKEWRYKHDVGRPVTREMMMIALQNLQHVLLRATDSSDATSAVLKDVTLDIAAEGSPVSSRKALGVEKCICPTNYAGTSCQNPGIGFFRWFKDNYIQSTIIIDLVGESRPCECNGRTETCHSETGHCQNCRENTAGPNCEVCASGYYGDPLRAPCRACACPTRRQNFAESCETDPANDKEYICHCKEGYKGAKCDRCAHGYYGKPRQRGGSCQPCDCDPFGSVDGSCDVRGDCKCRPGITGQKCSQCAPGHVVHASGCKSCKDGCVDVLQAEVQQMISDVINLNVSSFIPPPWNKLREIEKNVTLLRTNLDNYHSSIEVSRNLLVKFDLDYYAKDLLRKAEKLGMAARETFPPTAEVKREAQDVLDLLLSLRMQLKETVAYLENYAIGETPSVSVGSALLEAEKILEELKRRDFSKFHRDAIRELKRSTKLLEHLKEMVVNVSHVNGLRAKATALEDKLLDLLEHIKQANQHTDKANFLNESNRERLSRVREYSSNIKSTNLMAAEQHRNASHMLREARSNLDAAVDNYEDLESLLLTLQNTSNYLEEHEGQIWRLNMEYRDKYVKATHDHAHDLMMVSIRLESLFNETRDGAVEPLKAAQAYERIEDALLNAELAAKNASAAAKEAVLVAYPGDPGNSLVLRAKQSLRKSQELHMKGEDLRSSVDGLSSQLDEQRRLLGNAQDNLNEASARTTSLNTMMDMQLTSNITAEIQDSRKEVTEALESVDVTLGQVTSIHSNLTRIKNEALTLNRFDNTLLNEIREKIMAAEGQTMKGVRLTTNIRTSADRIQNRSDDLRARIEALKRKIQQTRQYASSIRVSLTTDKNGECVRKYRPDLRPSTTTSLSLAYAINSKAQDASILYLGSQNQSDFMAVEMLNRRIHFTWDVGGGPQKLIHPTKLLTNDAGVTDDTRWYHIDIERIGNIGQLWVRPARLKGARVGGGSGPQDGPVTAAAPAGFSKMDIRSDDSLWVGGFPESARHILKATSFAGCLHYVSLDGEKVGLWNFTESHGCSACNEGFDLVTRQEDETAFSFNGKGYFKGTNRIRRPKDYYSVVLAFNTLDQDALLFLAVNPDKNQYFSLSLEGDQVVFVVQFDAGTRLTMRSDRRLTTAAARADMTQIQAIVQNRAIDGERIGRLVVGDQDQLGTKKGGPDLDLASYPFYFGGVDPEFDKARWQEDLTLRSLLGCMTGLRVLDEGKNPLTDGQSYGIENSCSKKPLKDVGFPGRGFVELPSHVLRRNSSFGFSFRTMEPNGLLMLSTFIGQDDDVEAGPYTTASPAPTAPGLPLKRGQEEHPKDFYSVSVVEGFLDIRLNAGEGSVRLLSNARFNDGVLHSFFVLKTNRKIRLLVDDTEVNSTRLDKGGTVVAGPDTGGLYFGGVPPGLDVREMVGSSLPLKGCIRDVIVNDNLVSFSNPLQFDQVFIGRCWDLPSTQMQSMEGHMKAKEACMPPTQHTVEYKALKFGDRADSHVMVPVPRSTFKSDFIITFEFRTYYPNAVFFVAARIRKRKKSVQAVLAELRNGQVQVTLLKRGRKFFVTTTGSPFNTGTWHKVTVDKRRNRVRVYTGGAMRKAKVPAKLNVGSRLLLGGLPSPQHQLNSLQMTEPLRGCLRNVNLNGDMYEIPSATRKDRVMGVGQCFAAVQPGSYFPGDAYAIYSDKFNVGSLLELRLEFRTWELNGVLLSVADPRGSALSLQMYDGQVVLSVHMGHSHQFQAQVSLHNKFVLCDNEWHTVKASYVKDSLTLKVDTHPEAYGFNGSTKGGGTETEAALYIGGLPDSALRGTLSSRDNFKGCIRNVVLNSERRDWTDMYRLHGVLLNACPVQ